MMDIRLFAKAIVAFVSGFTTTGLTALAIIPDGVMMPWFVYIGIMTLNGLAAGIGVYLTPNAKREAEASPSCNPQT